MTPKSSAPSSKPAAAEPGKPERIAKIIAASGLCSRRDAERFIEEGRVRVEGKTIRSPALNVDAGTAILVDGKPLATNAKMRLFLYHKPVSVITTHKDERGRKTVFDSLPEGMPRVVSIGRLDINSEGLLLLTTSGELARHLSLPATGWIRRYRVRVYGAVEDAKLTALKKGVTIEGVRYGAIDVKRIDASKTAKNFWLEFSITEGKNREVRRVCDYLDLRVSRLIRTSFGPFQLGGLAPGEVKEVTRKQIAELLGAEWV